MTELPEKTTESKKMLKNNTYFKIGIIILITLSLLIPTNMIKGLITEREETQSEATVEVSSNWAEKQIIIGPLLSIPYMANEKEIINENNFKEVKKVKEYLHILPSQLNITGNIKPEKRYRGIYEVVVYNSLINISGTF